MTILLSVDSGSVIPSQDFLKEDTLRHIFECYKTGNLEKLPPPPIVRNVENSFVAIDGHNLLAVNYLLGKSTEVYVAKNPDDGLPGESESAIKRNNDLKEKFDLALEVADSLKLKGINSIVDLVKYTKVRVPLNN